MKTSSLLHVTGYCVVGSQLSVLNKIVLLKWGSPNTVLLCQLAFTTLMIGVGKLSQISQSVADKAFKETFLGVMQDYLPLVIAFFMLLLSSMQLLHSVPVPMFLVLKALTCGVFALADHIFFDRELPDLKSSLSLFFIVCGAATYGTQNIFAGFSERDLRDTFAVVRASSLFFACSVTEGIIAKQTIDKHELDNWVRSLILNFLSLPFCLAISLATEQTLFGPLASKHSNQDVFLLFLSCVLGLLMSYFTMTVRESFSTATVAVIGTANKFLSLFTSLVFLKEKNGSYVGVIGCLISIFASAFYSQASLVTREQCRDDKNIWNQAFPWCCQKTLWLLFLMITLYLNSPTDPPLVNSVVRESNDSATRFNAGLSSRVIKNTALIEFGHHSAREEPEISEWQTRLEPTHQQSAHQHIGLACSPLRRGDRSGSVIHDMLFAWAFAEVSALEYLGPVGERKELRDLQPALDLFGVPFKIHPRFPSNCTLLNPKQYRNESILSQAFPALRKQIISTTSPANTCVVHVRRGDVTESYHQAEDYFRWWPVHHYLHLIDEYCKNGERVIIHSERLNDDERKIMTRSGYEMKRCESVLCALKDFVTAKVFIMSSSSFSYNAAFFAKGTVVYTPFWHKALPGWIVFGRKMQMPWSDVAASFETETLPCLGQEHGSTSGPTMSACMISPKTTHLFEEPLRASQTMYICWSLFQHHATPQCAFNLVGLDPNNFFIWLAHRMGCAVQIRGKACMHTSLFSRKLDGVKVGGEYSWFNSKSDATRLRETVTRQIHTGRTSAAAKKIGILQSWQSSEIVFPNVTEVQTADRSHLEKLDFDDQVAWWNAHDIIIVAHDTSIWAAPFAERCTAVILVHPMLSPNTTSYESLVADSGSVTISWWPSSNVSHDDVPPNQGEADVKDIPVDEASIGSVQRNITVSEREFKDILAEAIEKRKQCMLADT